MSDPTQTMEVTIRDQTREAPWGHGLTSPCVRKVTISANCPTCGGPRGEPRGLNQCDDGAYYWTQVWSNACGHVDYYQDVAREAQTLAATVTARATELDGGATR